MHSKIAPSPNLHSTHTRPSTARLIMLFPKLATRSLCPIYKTKKKNHRSSYILRLQHTRAALGHTNSLDSSSSSSRIIRTHRSAIIRLYIYLSFFFLCLTSLSPWHHPHGAVVVAVASERPIVTRAFITGAIGHRPRCRAEKLWGESWLVPWTAVLFFFFFCWCRFL